jgi:hypothetical protein
VNTWHTFLFTGANRIALENATTYWIVMQGDYAIDGTNYVIWNRVTSGTYTGGVAMLYDGASWSGSGSDNLFAVIGKRNAPAVDMPSGYDEKCLLGYVKTIANAASIVSSTGHDRQYIDRAAETDTDRVLANPANTTPIWFTAALGVSSPSFGLLPYIPTMRLTARAYGVSAALSFGFGGATATDITNVISTTKFADASHYPTTATAMPSQEIPIDIGREGGVIIAASATSGSVVTRTGFRW